jgi:hypothetical protein
MKTIQIMYSGVLLLGALLWVKTAAQRRIDSDFREWRSRLSRKS